MHSNDKKAVLLLNLNVGNSDFITNPLQTI